MNKQVLAGALALVLVGGAAHAQQKKIAIVQNGPHPTLNQTVEGFKEGLAKLGYVEGRNVTYTFTMGNFQPALIPQLLAQAESGSPDLIMTVTTPVAQVARSAVKNQNIPIVFTVVSDPIKAEIVPSWEKGSDRFVGVANLHNMEAVMKFGKSLVPTAKVMGLPYNPAEANDVTHMELAQKAATALGMQIKPVPVETSNDVTQRVQSLRGVDFIYLLPSNLLMPAAPAVAAAAAQMGTPLIAASFPIVQQHGAVASFGISYTKLGHVAAEKAVAILKDGKKPSELSNHLPVEADHEVFFSARLLKSQNLTVPAAYKDCKTCIYE